MQIQFVYTILSICLSLLSVHAMSQDKLNGSYTIKDFSYSIELSNGIGELQLARNSCRAKYETKEENSFIQFTIVGCTKVCCDNEMDELLKANLSEVTSFSIHRKELVLYGPDTLYLMKVKPKKVQDDFSF